jgi:hypothetical protein
MGGARGHFRRAPWSGNFLGQSRPLGGLREVYVGMVRNVRGKKILRSAIGVILVRSVESGVGREVSDMCLIWQHSLQLSLRFDVPSPRIKSSESKTETAPS